jgi:hypothetical protein
MEDVNWPALLPYLVRKVALTNLSVIDVLGQLDI